MVKLKKILFYAKYFALLGIVIAYEAGLKRYILLDIIGIVSLIFIVLDTVVLTKKSKEKKQTAIDNKK